MKPKLLFVHTLASLVDVFNRLAGRLLPSVERIHIVDEPLLERVRRRGALAPADSERLRRHVEMAGDIGADAVLAEASRAGKQLQTELILVEDALDALRSGDLPTHDRLIAKAASELIPRADAVMLAQASMARAIDAIPPDQRAKVLSSPHLALASLAALFRPAAPPE